VSDPLLSNSVRNLLRQEGATVSVALVKSQALRFMFHVRASWAVIDDPRAYWPETHIPNVVVLDEPCRRAPHEAAKKTIEVVASQTGRVIVRPDED
jgi:hypothetical protein